MKTTPKPIPEKQKYPKTIFVENVGEADDPEFIVQVVGEELLASSETQIVVAVYEFKKMVVVTREEKIVVTDK